MPNVDPLLAVPTPPPNGLLLDANESNVVAELIPPPNNEDPLPNVLVVVLLVGDVTLLPNTGGFPNALANNYLKKLKTLKKIDL